MNLNTALYLHKIAQKKAKTIKEQVKSVYDMSTQRVIV